MARYNGHLGFLHDSVHLASTERSWGNWFSSDVGSDAGELWFSSDVGYGAVLV